MTQTLIIHVIRTNLIPFIQSRASWQLTMTTLLIMAIGAYLPFSPLASTWDLCLCRRSTGRSCWSRCFATSA